MEYRKINLFGVYGFVKGLNMINGGNRDVEGEISFLKVVRYPFLLLYNNFRKIMFYLGGGTRYGTKGYEEKLLEALGKSIPRSDISDHLSTIFYFTTEANPRLIVELGTRGGESTRVLLAASSHCNSTMLSVDIEDCENIDLPFIDLWNFVKADDIEFGISGFKDWCRSKSIQPIIDVLFIDTSHEYEHTKREIEVWTEHLAEDGLMIFHDTNMGSGVYSRNDGSVGLGWKNDRGVIRALEELMGRQYDENSYFCDFSEHYCIFHFPNCSGLSVLKRRPA